MKDIRKIGWMLFAIALVLLFVLLMQPISVIRFHEKIALLFPKGIIALEQRNLLLIIQAIMLLIILPVYILTFIFSWHYRSYNKKARYDPDLIDNKLAEYIWWGIPCLLTLVVGILSWEKTFELDPYKPLKSDKKAITIQVVALQWKWLFIYPEEQVATVNFIQFPTKTPIHFVITSDAPMNSFWIPALGGQIYAMPKMRTELNLIADEAGEFRGSSANLSGEGFAGMRFIAKASTEQEYQDWLKAAKQSAASLSLEQYKLLAEPSKDNPVALYQLKEANLFDQVIMKYMHPQEIR
jgi:cytochrome o ubiquinol oxidase subunit II